jgi:hypothetical protein
VRLLNAVGVGAGDKPVPLKPIVVVPLVAELVVTVNWPVAVPETAGLNSTVTL